jgi:hypothetical protein
MEMRKRKRGGGENDERRGRSITGEKIGLGGATKYVHMYVLCGWSCMPKERGRGRVEEERKEGKEEKEWEEAVREGRKGETFRDLEEDY